MALNFILGAVILFGILVAWSLRILREYERGVVFQLGRFWMVKGPGLIVIWPVIQQMVRVELRTIVLDVPPQDVITRDNVSVKVNAVVYFRVVDPQKAIIQVSDFLVATSQLAQTTLRAVLGKHELDGLLGEREKLNVDIQKTLDLQTEAWGIKVTTVEIKDVDLNESMVRAIARQAEAEHGQAPFSGESAGTTVNTSPSRPVTRTDCPRLSGTAERTRHCSLWTRAQPSPAMLVRVCR